ncbi:hypothetical protein OAA60_03510 [Porticoccaceae bacterium]|nr:hypothetical protein [Porticoccaceae bacterium]
MSFDSKKNTYGEKLSHGVSIFPNACRYTVDGAFNKGVITVEAIPFNTIGFYDIAMGDPMFFITSEAHMIVEDEIMSIDVISPTKIGVTGRGKFGTASVSHPAGPARIIHGGEADGSCLGYPKRPDGGGCSTNDSFSRDAEREFLFIDSQSFGGQKYYNGLKSLNHMPCEVKPGVSMAKNASNAVVIGDNTDDDVYSVPYTDRRTSNSTLFKKLIARTGGYLQNRRAVVYTGFEKNGNFSKDDCIMREYIIDDASLNKSNFSLALLDPLMLSEESKTKIPPLSLGRLLNAINNASTTIELKDFIDGEYGADGSSATLIVDGELIECSVTSSVLGTFSIVSRGVGGSEEKDHSVNATAQIVIVLTNFNPITEIINALQTTNIESRFYGDYSTAIANTPNATGPGYIYKPDSVAKYVNLIIRTWAESNITLYFDEREQTIKIKTVGDFEQQPLTLDYTTDIRQESLVIKPQYKKQFTRSAIGFAPFNAAKNTDDENSGIVFESINPITELTGTLEPQIDKTFYSQLLTNSDTDIQIAVSGAARIANLNTKPPEIFTFKIDYSNYGVVTGGLIEEAEIINITTDETVDDYGNPKANNVQILSLKDNASEATYSVKAITYQDIINEGDYDFIIDSDRENYILSDEFSPANPGQYTIFIVSGVTIGATSALNFAFDTGNQALGVTFKIICRGGILGAGGNGVNAVDATLNTPSGNEFSPGLNGLNGGDSLNLTVDCVLDVSQGVVFSGGGGAPSTDTTAFRVLGTAEVVNGGNGGSGGQGYVGGKGGGFGVATITFSPTASDKGLDGVDGSRAANGEVGGIPAGAFGESSGSSLSSGLPSEAGYAIKSNGNNISIIGDNDLTIKGLRDF